MTKKQKVVVYVPLQSLKHISFPFFSEKPERLEELVKLFSELELPIVRPMKAAKEVVLRAHEKAYVDYLETMSTYGPTRRFIANITSDYLQWYTRVSRDSYEAALYSVGAVCQAVESTLSGKHDRSFCAVRPPGHHAGIKRGEGFCLLNNVAIGALHGLSLGAKRIAVIDFDRHHGNGTQEIITAHGGENILFVSSYQAGCKYAQGIDTANLQKNIIMAPIPEHADVEGVLGVYFSQVILPLRTFKPDLILISAGFDMHKSDPLTNIRMESHDYGDLTKMIVDCAQELCGGRIVSVLEGGYNTEALKACVGHHLKSLRE